MPKKFRLYLHTSAILWAIWTICLVLVKVILVGGYKESLEACYLFFYKRSMVANLFHTFYALLVQIGLNGVRRSPFSVTLGAINIDTKIH
jgi:hypothetical protein